MLNVNSRLAGFASSTHETTRERQGHRCGGAPTVDGRTFTVAH
jgi:hypothetical protein